MLDDVVLARRGRVQADAQSKKQQEQLERLRKDMGAVNMQTATPPTGEEA